MDLLSPIRRMLTHRLTPAALGLFLAFTSFAQERTGQIRGTVTDQSGATIPGAALEASSPALVRPITTESTGSGQFLFPALPPGRYELKVTAKGFSTLKQAGVELSIGRVINLDLKMEVGAVSESITVSSEGAIIETTSSQVSTSITAETYDKLPKGRGFASLLALAPGTRPETKGGGFSVDGASGSENVFVVDGVEMTSIQTGTLNAQSNIPIEWVADTQIKSSGIDAQFGGATGGVASVTTRSGGNEFHGQVSLYLRNDAFNAGPRPLLRLNPSNDNIADYFQNGKDGWNGFNPGFRLGGPILRNRIWFFASAYPESNEFTRTTSVRGATGTQTFTQNIRQDYGLAKMDFAPTSKLRGSASYYYMPRRVNGLLPSYQGTDPASAPWADQGSRSPQANYNWSADYQFSPTFSVNTFGGFNYRNFKDYGVPAGTRYRYANGNTTLPITSQIPANLLGPAGNFTPNNQQTVQDIYTRNNANVAANWIFGKHNLRFGWGLNRLANRPNASTWPDGYIFVYWDRTRQFETKSGSDRGPFGYYINRVFGTLGDVSSNNQGIFIQDSWRVTRNLTLNLGIRTEREFVPSFSDDPNIPSSAIEFGFGQKIAPRLGMSWDPTGRGNQRLYASWGLYYDIMKYELPRGSFGGDKWKDYYYSLDTTNIFNIKPGKAPNSANCQCPGRLLEIVDRRIPSNDPADSLIDPNLKPFRLQSLDIGYDYNFTESRMLLGVRYVHKQVDSAIEDVGILTPQGEQYFIANPGFGVTIDERKWPAGYPTDVTPKAVRDYDAVEFRATKRFGSSSSFTAQYVVSRLYGNYSGLASSDEEGRTSPNVNRFFDEPWMSYDAAGKPVFGRLGTDRPHTFKLFGNYDRKSRLGTTTLAPYFFLGSGTPISSQVHVQGVPVLFNGRGDLGRTPAFSQTDFVIFHDLNLGSSETRRIRFEANFTNLFNQATVTNYNNDIDHQNDGGVNFTNTADIFKGYNVQALLRAQSVRNNPMFRLASGFQGPREIRLGFHFFF
jgi:hypothetical protein